MTWDRRNSALRIARILQDLGDWVARLGRPMEDWRHADRFLGSLASTWADNKSRRHILPMLCDDERALCGMEQGLFGWENQNNLHSRDLPPGVCVRCMVRFYAWMTPWRSRRPGGPLAELKGRGRGVMGSVLCAVSLNPGPAPPHHAANDQKTLEAPKQDGQPPSSGDCLGG